jgi:hypothetical protein
VKTRQGFVSNSSSSSFIIGCNEDLTIEYVTNALQTHKMPVLKRALVKAWADFLARYADRLPTNEEAFAKYVSEHWMVEEAPKIVQDMRRRFKFVYILSAGTDASDEYSRSDCIGYVMWRTPRAFEVSNRLLKIKAWGCDED